MFRKSTTFTAVGAALVLSLPATALGQSSERFGVGSVNQFEAQATEAQVLRGRALHRYYAGRDFGQSFLYPGGYRQPPAPVDMSTFFEGNTVSR